MKLAKIHIIEGEIKLLTGLHIGGSKDSIEIGGMDQPIIKHPITGEPYIPGSSIKGRMRSLLELAYFADGIKNGKPCSDLEKCPFICKMFGISGSEKSGSEEIGPTRLIVRDAYLHSEDSKRFQEGNLPMEEKYETAINRIEGTALRGSLRPIERVPSSVKFNYSFSLKIFEDDEESRFLDLLYKGMRLIELDGLGGQTSRGSGQIKFVVIKEDGQNKSKDFLEELNLNFEG